MNLPSVAFIAERSLRTFTRFPFAVLSAAVGTAAVLILAQEEFNENHPLPWLFNVAVVGFLGISLMTFAQLWAERFDLRFRHWLGLHLTVAAVIVLYWYILPENVFASPLQHLFRFWLFVLATHVFVAVGPFLGHGSVETFWEFNKTLLLRLVSSGLYAGVLYVGLAIALAAIDNLFNADIRPIRYLQLWWLLVGIFNTVFFLSGVPRVSRIEQGVRYPKGLKSFAQYVLVPLVTVYLAILYAYMGKIIIEWDWPQGWVGYLVLGFSVSGIFTLLVIHPIKDALDNAWMAVITKRFYVAILPPSILLLLAIWRRISEYGLTENRYFVVVLGLWLIAISFYFLMSSRRNIKAIPISLGILALFCSVGPWSAMSVSRANQMDRLEHVLQENDMLADGRIVQAGTSVTYEDAERISSVIRYLIETHGGEVLQPWFNLSLDSLAATSEARWRRSSDVARIIVATMGIEYVPEFRGTPDRKIEPYTFTSGNISLPIGEYEHVHIGRTLDKERDSFTFRAGSSEWLVSLEPERSRVSIEQVGRVNETVELSLTPVIQSLIPARAIPYQTVTVQGDSMVVSGTSGSVGGKAFLRRLVLERDSSGVKVAAVTLDVFVRD